LKWIGFTLFLQDLTGEATKPVQTSALDMEPSSYFTAVTEKHTGSIGIVKGVVDRDSFASKQRSTSNTERCTGIAKSTGRQCRLWTSLRDKHGQYRCGYHGGLMENVKKEKSP
jgi:hypothetical protein